MEPVTTSAMIGTVVGYLAKKFKENKAVKDFFNDFTEATVNWIRPLFLKEDDQPKELIEDLKTDPDDKLNTDAVENAIAKALKKEPNLEQHLKAMYEAIKKGGNSLGATGFKAVGDIQITAEQKGGSKANFDDFDAGGKITIDIKQE